MPIPALPLFKHRDTVVTPADQNQFVTQFENTMDTMSNDVIPAINLAITDINEKVITATTARDESEDARDMTVAAKDEALTAVATLQEGAIDDTIIAPNKAFSNSYIQANYYDKTEVDTAISDATLDINTLPDKPTPVNTDNLALQETGGLLKKLSFANLMNWIKSFSIGWGQTWQDVTASRDFGVIYQNTSGKPIEVNVYIDSNTFAVHIISFFVDNNGNNIFIRISSCEAAGGEGIMLSGIVPNNCKYKVEKVTAGSAYIGFWSELR